ncbi:MAG: hypothetical protein KKA07_15085 [Bacteroidetes bacterium]|nr:hypothetical protein [Bacteroidota bacterium]MBU1720386.1 hypothetical protein [Bacteroidota bacterium]
MKSSFGSKFLFSFAVLVVSSYVAASGQWAYNGSIEGGTIAAITVVNDKVFLVSDEGFFESTSMGKTWTKVDITAKIPINDVRKELSIVKAVGPNIFLGTKRGLFVSNNGGEEWTLFNEGLPRGRMVMGLKSLGDKLFCYTQKDIFQYDESSKTWVDIRYNLPPFVYLKDVETMSNRLYVATFGKGIYEFDPTASEWIPRNDSLPTEKIVTLAASGNMLIAGTNRSGIVVSTDGGLEWKSMSDSLPPKTSVFNLMVVGGKVFAGTPNGIWVSSDNCKSWYNATPEFSSNMAVVNFGGSGSNIFAGTEGLGLLSSNNLGATWDYANIGLSIALPVKTLLYKSNVLYAGTAGGGAFKSTNGGQNWVPINSGLPKKLVVNCMDAQDSVLYLAAPNAIYTSLDWGKQWRNSGGFMFIGKGFNTIEILDRNAYVGSTDGIYFTTNGGGRWEKMTTEGMTNSNVKSIAINIGKKDTVFYVGTDDGLYFSDTKANIWKKAVTDKINKVRIVRVIDDEIYVCTEKFFSIIKSSLDAEKWEMMPTGLDKQGIPGKFVAADIVKTGKKNLYVVGDKGVFVSNNMGRTWAELIFGLVNTNIVSFVASRSQFFTGDSEGNISSMVK